MSDEQPQKEETATGGGPESKISSSEVPQQFQSSQVQSQTQQSKSEAKQPPSDFKPSMSKENIEQEIQKIKDENEWLGVWVKVWEKLEQKYKVKNDAFKQFDKNTSGTIEQDEFFEGLKECTGVDKLDEKKNDIFTKINKSGGAGITQDEWTVAWTELVQQFEENIHRTQMFQQKLSILNALETPAEEGKRLEGFDIDNNNKGPMENSLYYLLYVFKFRGASSLADFSNMFNQVNITESPIQKRILRMDQQQPPPQNEFTFDFRASKDKNQVQPEKSKKLDLIFSQYKTPKKGFLEEPEKKQQARTTYINFEQQQIQVPKPSSNNKMGVRSPFTQPQNYISNNDARVYQQMTYFPEQNDIKVGSKTNRRKDELFNFMGKIGLGKQEQGISRPTLQLDTNNVQLIQHRQNLERMKNFVSGKDIMSVPPTYQQFQANSTTSVQAKKFSSGLNDLFLDSGFQKKVSRNEREKSKSRSISVNKESFGLVQQSLQNYTQKLIHQHKYGVGSNNSNTASPSLNLSIKGVSPAQRFQSYR